MALLINHSEKWAFLHIPKTGGNSLSEILSTIKGTEFVTTHNDLSAFGNIEDYFIFTFVRNPFTRLASWYHHELRMGCNKNFDNFIKSIFEHNFLYFPQTFFLNNNKTEKRNISFIGRYENYSNDINFLFKKLGHPTPRIPHLNKNTIYERHPNLNQQKYYKSLYKEDWIKDWVRAKYKDDFQNFNYELDI